MLLANARCRQLTYEQTHFESHYHALLAGHCSVCLQLRVQCGGAAVG
jgi:hypothetical protein